MLGGGFRKHRETIVLKSGSLIFENVLLGRTFESGSYFLGFDWLKIDCTAMIYPIHMVVTGHDFFWAL